MTSNIAPGADASLTDWLSYQERLHPRDIAMGLERVRGVAQRLGLLPAQALTLTVGGTNGKGSSATLAADIYRIGGYRVGRYTSPHLFDYNERIAIDGDAVSDASLIRAFAIVETARGTTPLTFFEFGTLAALWLFRDAQVAVQVLEVGLGGRLDAVNIIDPDCALLTNVGLDHLDWLGPDLDSVGFEKAGIFRHARPAVCAQAQPPGTVKRVAKEIGADLLLRDRDFRLSIAPEQDAWNWSGADRSYSKLPRPGLFGRAQFDNAAGVIAAISALQDRVPVAEQAVREALPGLRLPGRYERHGKLVFDVAHNVEAALVLADNLRADGAGGRIVLVLGMLADKPVESFCSVVAPLVRQAFFGGLPPPRGLDAERLRARASKGGLNGIAAGGIEEAFRRAWHAAGADDIVLVCGSFFSVAATAKLAREMMESR